MKKLIVILVVVCLLFAGAMTYTNRDNIVLFDDKSADESGSSLDFQKLYKLHSPDTVIMAINGEDVLWSEYCAYLYRYCVNAENLFATYAMYGMNMGWDSPYDESGVTIAQYLAESPVDTLVQARAIMSAAKEYGIELSEDSLATLDEGLKTDIASLCGEDATEDDFFKALGKQYMSPEMYEFNRRLSCYSADTFDSIYGKDCEKVSDADAVKFLDDNGYMTAGHILFLTIDPTTGESLDDSAAAEKLEKATAVSEELKAIADTAERKARFIELKAELCEDTGKTAYPVAYVFQSGVMVAEFEAAVKSMGDYEVSDPVKTNYGYHVIIRLPHDPDLPLYSSSGENTTARQACASSAFSGILDGKVDASDVKYLNGFVIPDLMNYIK